MVVLTEELKNQLKAEIMEELQKEFEFVPIKPKRENIWKWYQNEVREKIFSKGYGRNWMVVMNALTLVIRANLSIDNVTLMTREQLPIVDAVVNKFLDLLPSKGE